MQPVAIRNLFRHDFATSEIRHLPTGRLTIFGNKKAWVERGSNSDRPGGSPLPYPLDQVGNLVKWPKTIDFIINRQIFENFCYVSQNMKDQLLLSTNNT